MDLKTYERFKKFMRMTTSDTDAEVLMAIRKANELLAKYGHDWDKIFAAKVKVVQEIEDNSSNSSNKTSGNPKYKYSPRPRANSVKHSGDYVQIIIEKAIVGIDSNSAIYRFITSLQAYYIKNNYLTDAQYNSLKQIVQSL